MRQGHVMTKSRHVLSSCAWLTSCAQHFTLLNKFACYHILDVVSYRGKKFSCFTITYFESSKTCSAKAVEFIHEDKHHFQ